ncbi:MAG: PKD domain-containing protein, partial [Candidatus Paceibacterota bacterium]
NEDTDADNDGIPKTIDVNDTNLGPIVVITSSGVAAHRIAMPGEPIQFETTTSYDPDGKVVSTLWDVEGQKTSGDKLETSFDKLGSHKIIATLTDDKNEARQVNFSVLIVPPWLPWAIIIAILLIFILAIFVVFSYSKRRRSRFNRVMEYLETISKFIPTPKKK